MSRSPAVATAASWCRRTGAAPVKGGGTAPPSCPPTPCQPATIGAQRCCEGKHKRNPTRVRGCWVHSQLLGGQRQVDDSLDEWPLHRRTTWKDTYKDNSEDRERKLELIWLIDTNIPMPSAYSVKKIPYNSQLTVILISLSLDSCNQWLPSSHSLSLPLSITLSLSLFTPSIHLPHSLSSLSCVCGRALNHVGRRGGRSNCFSSTRNNPRELNIAQTNCNKRWTPERKSLLLMILFSMNFCYIICKYFVFGKHTDSV